MKTLIIIGSARCANEEFREALNLCNYYCAFDRPDIMAINLAMAGLHWLHTTESVTVNHWVSMHPELFYAFHDLHPKPETHSNMLGQKVDTYWPSLNHDGLSGLFALKVAVGLKRYQKIVIAGCPMDHSGHFYDFPGAKFENNYGDVAVRMAWNEYRTRNKLEETVRGMSGIPADIYGTPTKEWLND